MAYQDLVRLIVRIIALIMLILTIFAGILYSTKPHAALYFVVAILLLGIIDIEIYWVHEIHHAWMFGDLLLIWLLACLLFSVVGAVFFVWTEHRHIETENHGWLVPANDATPRNACSNDGQVPVDATVIIVGNSAAFTTWPRPDYIPFLFDGCTYLQLTKTDKGISISVDIFGVGNHLVTRIEANEFHINGNEMSYRGDQDDPSTLTVYGLNGQEILRVRYINPQTIDIRGKFYCHGNELQIGAKGTVRKNDNIISGGNCVGGGIAGYRW